MLKYLPSMRRWIVLLLVGGILAGSASPLIAGGGEPPKAAQTKKAKKGLRSSGAAEVSGTAGVRGLELQPDEAPKKKKTWKSKKSKP